MAVQPRAISEENFRRLQAYAEPLVDSVDTVLARILDFYDSNRDGHPRAIEAAAEEGSFIVSPIWVTHPAPIQRRYDPFDPPIFLTLA